MLVARREEFELSITDVKVVAVTLMTCVCVCATNKNYYFVRVMNKSLSLISI